MTQATERPLTGPAAVHAYRAGRERARILRGVVLLVLAGVAYVAVVLWQRDTTRIHKRLEILGPFQRTVQAAWDASRTIPLRIADKDPRGKPLPVAGFTYLTPDEIRALREFDGAVMLGYTDLAATMLRTDGRAVLIGEKGRYTVRWLPHGEFAEWKKRQETWVQERQRQLRARGPRLP